MGVLGVGFLFKYSLKAVEWIVLANGYFGFWKISFFSNDVNF
jgi:hypothetical protein